MENEIQKQESQQAPQEAKNLLEDAKRTAERIEEANKKAEELLKRQEENLAREMLSGRSSAGTTVPVVDKEAEAKARINEMLKSTGMKI